jgi:aerobic carbon-monoxide dehydrogenase medium subunit
VIFGSHAAISPFRLARPRTVEGALADLAEDDGAVLMAGGTDLVPAMRAGRRVGVIVSLAEIAELGAIERGKAGLRIGAGATLDTIGRDRTVGEALPGFAALCRAAANSRVRFAATLGGNLMAGNPAYDFLPALAALGARLLFAGTDEPAILALGDGPSPPMPKNALLLAAEIPLADGLAFRMERGFKPAASVAVARWKGGARAAIGAAHESAVSFALDPAAKPEAAGADFARRLPAPVDDAFASSAYRRRLAGVLVSRLLAEGEAA